MRRDNSLEELISFLLETVAKDFKKQIYPRKYFNRLRELDTPAEKLVYLFLLMAQPQTFTSIRRLLRLNRNTVAKALKELVKHRFIVQDETFIYWILE